MVDDVVATLRAQGYATIPDAISALEVDTARHELEDILERTPPGRDDFEGRSTRRVYALFAKTRALDAMATHPDVLGVLDQVLGDYQLSAPAAISIGPGEVAQPLHPDDAIYPVARPHQELVVNVMWPLEGIHRCQRRHPDRRRQPPLGRRTARPGDAGDDGRDARPHGAALPRQCVARRWCQSDRPCPAGRRASLRLGVAATGGEPRAVGAAGDGQDPAPRLQELLGYNIYPPFIGYVDGRHPRKLLTTAGAP